MKFKNKKEVIEAYKNGKLAKWEIEPILEHIEFLEAIKTFLKDG